MAQRRHHYEAAFEWFLRDQRIPYVAVDEAKKALLPLGASLRAEAADPESGGPDQSLKSFDFVVYGSGLNLLVEVKGRKFVSRSRKSPQARAAGLRLESWVNSEDVRSMQAWQRLFGPEFRAAFIFLYWCDDLPADGLFEEIVEHRGRWYALRAVMVDEYAESMRVRSPRWGTVHIDSATFRRISHPFRGSASLRDGGPAGGVGLPTPVLEPIGA